MNTSQAPSDPARVRVGEALARLAVDAHALPPSVLARLQLRARTADARLGVGRYLIVGELGRGGMGVVYDAWDPGIERRVAIKTIEPELVPEEDREEIVERFRRETKVVGQLNHPAIVTIYDYGQERALDPSTGSRVPSLLYYVMEYLEGQSLAQALHERGRLPDPEAVGIAAVIAEALQVSHEAGIIHRDIKPSNIFLRYGTEAVLLDFGIAKIGSDGLTRQGQILGTPSYLAPERLKEKERPIDGRADVFSLGILLFTMLTGEAPFIGYDVYEVIDKISKQSHPDVGRIGATGRRMSRVLDRMLAKQPEDRYATAGEAAADLRALWSALSEGQESSPSVAPSPVAEAFVRRAQPSEPIDPDEPHLEPTRITPPPRVSPVRSDLSAPPSAVLSPPPLEPGPPAEATALPATAGDGISEDLTQQPWPDAVRPSAGISAVPAEPAKRAVVPFAPGREAAFETSVPEARASTSQEAVLQRKTHEARSVARSSGLPNADAAPNAPGMPKALVEAALVDEASDEGAIETSPAVPVVPPPLSAREESTEVDANPEPPPRKGPWPALSDPRFPGDAAPSPIKASDGSSASGTGRGIKEGGRKQRARIEAALIDESAGRREAVRTRRVGPRRGADAGHVRRTRKRARPVESLGGARRSGGTKPGAGRDQE